MMLNGLMTSLEHRPTGDTDMGSFSAQEMAQTGAEFAIPVRQQLLWHLQSNHYPPIHSSMVEPCMEAIRLYDEDPYTEVLVALPEGVTWKGQTHAPVHAIIEQHHLWAWCHQPEEEN